MIQRCTTCMVCTTVVRPCTWSHECYCCCVVESISKLRVMNGCQSSVATPALPAVLSVKGHCQMTPSCSLLLPTRPHCCSRILNIAAHPRLPWRPPSTPRSRTTTTVATMMGEASPATAAAAAAGIPTATAKRRTLQIQLRPDINARGEPFNGSTVGVRA